jgi:hypothetical protein
MPYSRSWTSLALLAVAACAPAHTIVAQDADLPPAGFGSLRQDQVGVRMATPTLAVRVIPLDERVTRLLAPDAYRSLHDMRQSKDADIAAAARSAAYDSAAAFMVTFYGLQPSVQFNPDQLYISSQNATYRPFAVVPITPRWSEHLIDQGQQAAAIYLFEPGIRVLQPFTLVYAGQTSDAWSESLRQLNNERARVLARAQQQHQPQP